MIKIFSLSICFLLIITVKGYCQEIKVVTEYLAPYQIEMPDGSVGGFSTEVLRAIFKQANKKPNIIVMPWARAYKVVKEESNVMIYSIAHTKARHDLFHWIGSLTKERLYFWGLKSRFPVPIDIEALLKGYLVTASKNSNISQYLIDNNFFNIYHITVEDQSMKMLYSHRVDLLVDTELNARYRAKKLGLDFDEMIKIKEVTALNNDLSFAFNLQSNLQLVRDFQKAYQEVKAKGILDKIKQKWQITGG